MKENTYIKELHNYHNSDSHRFKATNFYPY